MRKLEKIVAGIVTMVGILVGLLYFFYSESETHLTGNYYYNPTLGVYIKSEDCSGHGRISQVDEVAWNERYLVVKKESGYYLIEMGRDHCLLNANEIVIGPLSKRDLADYQLQKVAFRKIN